MTTICDAHAELNLVGAELLGGSLRLGGERGPTTVAVSAGPELVSESAQLAEPRGDRFGG